MKKKIISLFTTLAILCGFICITPITEKTYASTDVSDLYPADSTYNFIKSVEGCDLQCFWDVAQWTIGYGNKCPFTHDSNGTKYGQKGGHTITESYARELFDSKLSGYVNTLKSNCKGLSMNQNQFDALLSATYNHGNVAPNGCKSCGYKSMPLVKYLQGSLTEAQAREQYYVWCINAGTSTEQVLRKRRKKEADLFFSDSVPISDSYFDFWCVDNGITISDTYKIWLKQSGLGNSGNSDVNLYIDGKNLNNFLGTLYQDENGFFSYELDTTKYSDGQHTIYAVFRNTTGQEIWVSRNILIQQNYSFDFWCVDNGTKISGTYKIWLKQVGLGNANNSDVNLYIDGKEFDNFLCTLHQDENGFFSYQIDTLMYPSGVHTIYAVFRNTSGKEIWSSRNLIFQSEGFFSFWGVENNVSVNGIYKIWLKQVDLGNANNSDVNLYIDGKEIDNFLDTLHQDNKGFFSFSLNTSCYSLGEHLIYAVFRNTSGVEIWQAKRINFTQTYGDVNNDGKVNETDCIELQKYITNSSPLINWKNVDLNEDDKINVFDLILLKRMLLKK